jgi:SAM-dependent methyltransferase
MIEKIKFNGETYPLFQSEGYASQFVIPFAKHCCKGIGVDVGCNRVDWMFAGDIINSKNIKDYRVWLSDLHNLNYIQNSFPIDPMINGYDALNFPEDCYNLDYVFSSHCLEHLFDWVSVLDYWTLKLKDYGTLFLYLPDYSQEYWRPWNNRKHVNIFTPQIIQDYLRDRGYRFIKSTGVDFNNSFVVVAEK